jgi:hypothetical protein
MTEDDFEQQERDRLAGTIAWLEAADPDDWHRFVLDFQWAESFDTLYWIVRQDRCDAATAQMLFWLCQPACFIEEDDGSGDDPDPYTDWNKEIVVHIARRFASGGYPRSELAHVPDTGTRTDYVDLLRMEGELQRPNFRTSPRLIETRQGRQVWPDRDFYARFPEAFWHGNPPSEPEEGVEYVPYEPPGYRETMRAVDLIEQEARRRLPSRLKTGPDPELDLTEVRSDARWLMLYMMSAGAGVISIAIAGSLKALIFCSVAILWTCWSTWSSLREIRTYLRYSRRQLNAPWAGALLGLVFVVAMGLTVASIRPVGRLGLAYGLLPTILAGLVVVLPLLWLVAKPLAALLLKPRGIVEF